MIYGVYAQYGCLDYHIEKSVEEAMGTLEGGQDIGACYAIGVYDDESNRVFIPHNEPIGAPATWLEGMLDNIRSICRLHKDHEFAEVERFTFSYDV